MYLDPLSEYILKQFPREPQSNRLFAKRPWTIPPLFFSNSVSWISALSGLQRSRISVTFEISPPVCSFFN